MKKKKIAARFLSTALAATMVLGLSMTAFAEEGGGQADTDKYVPAGTGLPGDFGTGASTSGNSASGYPVMEDGSGLSKYQYVDLEEYSKSDGISGVEADRGTITVKGLGEGVTVRAYRFIEPMYKAGGGFDGWKGVDGLTLPTGLVADGKADPNKLDRDNIADIAQLFLGQEGIKMDVSGGVATSDVAPGAYVIVVSGGESKTYGPMVVSLAYAADDELTGNDLVLVANMAYAKMQDEPQIDKEIEWAYTYEDMDGGVFNINTASGSKLGATAIAGEGEILNFDIIVHNIPEYHGDYITFNVVDTMSRGLTFGWDDGGDWVDGLDNVEFFVAFGEGQNINTATPININPEIKVTGDTKSGMSITFDFKGVYAKELLQYAGQDLFIRYSATIDTDSDMFDYDKVENTMHATNKAVVNFTHNSVVEGDDDSNETPDRNVYTFKLDLKKVDSTGKEALEGAVFRLENANPMENPTEDNRVFEGMDLTSDANGMITVEGIVPGTYTLTETKAPDGYVADSTKHTIEIKAVLDESTKELTGVTYTFDGKDMGSLAVVQEIKNTKMTELPSTGGIGSALFLIIGIGGAIIGLFVIFGSRRKDAE